MTCQPRREFADAKSVAQLAEPLRSRIAQAIADAPTGGLVLVSGKRTDYQQWLLRHERCPGRECSTSCKGTPTTARPGTSNHRNIDAAHCAADMGGRDLDWLGRNEKRYGLHRPVKGEKWHFEPHGTPTVPIRPYGQPVEPPKPADPNAGRHYRTFAANATDAMIYAKGGRNDQIAELQILFGLPADGVYGPNTVRAVVHLKDAAKWSDASGARDRSSMVTERFAKAVRALVAGS